MTYTFDTETSFDGEKAWVWSWALCDEEMRTATGNGLTMVDALTSLPDGACVWVHNLSYDGEYIYWALLDKGYRLEYGIDRYGKRHGVFELFEDLTGVLKIEIHSHGKRIVLRDSMRLFRCKLEKLPELCGFEDEDAKVSGFDYDSIRAVDHVKSAFEESYQVHDVTVLMRAVKWIRGIQAQGNTIGAISIQELKTVLNDQTPFKPLTIEERNGLRSLYSGGVVKLPDANAGVVITGADGKVA